MSNPYPAGSLQAVDYAIWEHGRDANAGELGFLRALRSLSLLDALRSALQVHAARPGYVTRVTAVALDGNGLVVEPLPKPNTKRELGDLAIVLTRLERTALRRRLWIVQSRVAAPGALTSIGNAKEVELYEHRPDFELLTGTHPQAKSLGRYSPRTDFARVADDVPPFWSWLLFAEAGPGGTPTSMPPARFAWPSSPPQVQTSFTDGLVRMAKAIGGAMDHGADVDAHSPHHEWRRLFVALWRNGTWRQAHYATTNAHDDVTTKSGVRFTRTEFSAPLAPEDVERYRRLATADDDAEPAEPATAPTGFDGPADGPRMPMLLIDQVLAGTPR